MTGPTPIPKPDEPDPLDSTGARCHTPSSVGPCHRRYDHKQRGDDRHLAEACGQWYEWKDNE